MSLDRFVYWRTHRRPSRAEIRHILVDFFAGVGSVRWRGDRWWVLLPGVCSHALRRARGIDRGYARTYADPRERWIEVWPDRDGTCIDIMTRTQDELTNALAAGLHGVILRWYQGATDPTS